MALGKWKKEDTALGEGYRLLGTHRAVEVFVEEDGGAWQFDISLDPRGSNLEGGELASGWPYKSAYHAKLAAEKALRKLKKILG